MATANQDVGGSPVDPPRDRIFQFTISLVDPPDDPGAIVPRLNDAGYPDIVFWEDGEGTTGSVHFTSMARTLGDAVGYAIHAVERAGYTVDRVQVVR